MKSQIRIISDAQLFFFALVFLIISLSGCAAAIWAVGQPGITASSTDVILIRVIFITLISALSIGLLLALSESVVLLTLTQDKISVQPIFSNRKSFSYKAFPFIYHGTYFHGNLFGQGYAVHYIVFSRMRLPAQALNSINKMKCSPDIIKIRYTPHTYDLLCSIVPGEVKKKISLTFKDHAK